MEDKVMERQTIPAAMFPLLADAFDELYERPYIIEFFNKTFFEARNVFDQHVTYLGIKKALRLINEEEEKPLDALASVIEELMEERLFDSDAYNQQRKNDSKKNYRKKIKKVLADDNLVYKPRVGIIKKADVASILFLQDDLSKSQYPSVTREITEARKNIEDRKYRQSLVNAGSMLEAACKLYLTRKNIDFNNGDALYNLWEKIKKHLGDDEMHENLTEGLNAVAAGVRKLRNEKSNAHGRTEEETRQGKIYARSAKLAVRSSITLSFYILEHLER